MHKVLLSKQIQKVMIHFQDQRIKKDLVIAKTSMETSKQATIFTGIIPTLIIRAINNKSSKREAKMEEGNMIRNKLIPIITQVIRQKRIFMNKPEISTVQKPEIKSLTGRTYINKGKIIKSNLRSNKLKQTNLVTPKKKRNGMEDTRKKKKTFIRSTIMGEQTKVNKTIQVGQHQTLMTNITTKSQTSMLSSMVNLTPRKRKYTKSMKLVKTLTSISKIEAIVQDQIYLTVGTGFHGYS